MKAYNDKSYQTRKDEFIHGDKDFERTAKQAMAFYLAFMVCMFALYMIFFAA